MPKGCSAASAPREAKSSFDEFVDLDQAMRWNSAGHQLDGQRHPIELATDVAYDLRISVTEVGGVTCGYGTLHEEP